MRKWEITAVTLVLAALVGLPLTVYAYQSWVIPRQRSGVITVVMRTTENGGIQPGVIRVKKGDTVRLLVTSQDVAHGIRIKEFDVNEYPISAGKYKLIEFVADQAGTFDFICNITCSPRHAELKGQLIVEDTQP
jgi:cytochrome c oxidase subunit 2